MADKQPQEEVTTLRRENARLRRQCADLLAQKLWLDGANYGRIDSELRKLGFRLDDPGGQNGTPRIVVLEGKR